MATPANAITQTSRLLTLPPEIRTHIYNYVLDFCPTSLTIEPNEAPPPLSYVDVFDGSTFTVPTLTEPPITATCREIRNETLAFIYNRLHLTFEQDVYMVTDRSYSRRGGEQRCFRYVEPLHGGPYPSRMLVDRFIDRFLTDEKATMLRSVTFRWQIVTDAEHFTHDSYQQHLSLCDERVAIHVPLDRRSRILGENPYCWDVRQVGALGGRGDRMSADYRICGSGREGLLSVADLRQRAKCEGWQFSFCSMFTDWEDSVQESSSSSQSS